jgi:hypothetical protein
VPPTGAHDLALLGLECATIFDLSASGRLLRRSSPDCAPAPRLRLAGCEAGNVLHFRSDVSDETARAVQTLAAREPPLALPHSAPTHTDEYVRLLGDESPVEHNELGLLWTFPESVAYDHPAKLVASGTSEGDALLAHLTKQGMPRNLVEAGFVDVGEFWAPWCVAFDGNQIASIAFAAGLCPEGAEVGVYTFPPFRGRGYAAAATAGWAYLPALRGRTLFYGTSRANLSSQRVAQRLGLRFLGSTLAIT